jgi:hypothetical protein
MAHSVLENDNFFAGFQEWDWIKVLYVVFHIILTFVVPSLLYSICWYERYSPDLRYRMLSNILLSHTCWIGIFRSIFARIPAVIMFISGPFPVVVCDAFSIFAKFSFVIFITELAIWQFIRFICITKGMKMRIVEDDLIAFYLTLSNLIISMGVTVASETLSFRISEIDHHICTGVDPNEAILKLNQMLWRDNTSAIIPQMNKLINADPSVKVVRVDLFLINFFAAASYAIVKKNAVSFELCKIFSL